jgi:hypothetical protein
MLYENGNGRLMEKRRKFSRSSLRLRGKLEFPARNLLIAYQHCG